MKNWILNISRYFWFGFGVRIMIRVMVRGCLDKTSRRKIIKLERLLMKQMKSKYSLVICKDNTFQDPHAI